MSRVSRYLFCFAGIGLGTAGELIRRTTCAPAFTRNCDLLETVPWVVRYGYWWLEGVAWVAQACLLWTVLRHASEEWSR